VYVLGEGISMISRCDRTLRSRVSTWKRNASFRVEETRTELGEATIELSRSSGRHFPRSNPPNWVGASRIFAKKSK